MDARFLATREANSPHLLMSSSAGHSSVKEKSQSSKERFLNNSVSRSFSASKDAGGMRARSLDNTSSQHLQILVMRATSGGPAGLRRPGGAARKSSTIRKAVNSRLAVVLTMCLLQSSAINSGSKRSASRFPFSNRE